MKIQCSVCGAAEASVLCCADEAALCWVCDQKLHGSSKISGKHHRVPLSNPPSQMPKCDICQETAGYFFCLEDRALLCRRCDVSIHTSNSLVSLHQRFLLTGVKVAALQTHNAELLSSTTQSADFPEWQLDQMIGDSNNSTIERGCQINLEGHDCLDKYWAVPRTAHSIWAPLP